MICVFMYIPYLSNARNIVTEDSLTIAISLSKDSDEKVSKYIELSKMFRYSDLKKSMNYATDALQVAVRGTVSSADAYYNLGIVMFYCDNFIDALDNMFKASEIYTKQKYTQGIIRCCQGIGNVYSAMNMAETAMSYYKEALSLSISLSRQDSSYRVKPSLYSCISVLYHQEKEYYKALEYARKSINESMDEDVQDMPDFMMNIAQAFVGLNELDSAFLYMKQAETKYREGGNKIGEILVMLAAASVEISVERFENANAILSNAEEISVQIGSVRFLKKIYDLYSQIHLQYGDYRQACKAMKKVNEYTDSLYSEKALESAMKIKFVNEYKMMEQQHLYEQAKARWQNSIIFCIAVFLGIIIIVILFLVKMRISKLNLEKENLKKDLELKTKELMSKVMFLMEKNELLNEYSKRSIEILDSLKGEAKQKMQLLIGDMRKSVDNSSAWDAFEKYFNNVYDSFYINLNESFPDLTPTELKLCALLRLNLSSKEISSLMNMSPGSVDVARARIRKKMNLNDTKENLVSFLLKY